MTQKKFIELAHTIYRELYANSTPKGDWDEMLKNAKINERGQKIINFDDYEIERELFEQILKKHIKGLRKRTQHEMSFTIYLGCSPKFKQ